MPSYFTAYLLHRTIVAKAVRWTNQMNISSTIIIVARAAYICQEEKKYDGRSGKSYMIEGLLSDAYHLR